MAHFTGISQIEQFAETPGNGIAGPFSCLLDDVRIYGCYSADRVTWIYRYDPESGRHPYAIGRLL